MTEQTVTPQLTQDEQLAALGSYSYGWADSDTAGATAPRGLSEAVVRVYRTRRANRSGCSTCG